MCIKTKKLISLIDAGNIVNNSIEKDIEWIKSKASYNEMFKDSHTIALLISHLSMIISGMETIEDFIDKYKTDLPMDIKE